MRAAGTSNVEPVELGDRPREFVRRWLLALVAGTETAAERSRRKLADRMRAYRVRNPVKAKARTKLGHAKRTGKVPTTPCVVCGSSENVQGHHTDYAKPLEVTWLCRPCHYRLHTAAPSPPPSPADRRARAWH